MKKQPNNKTKKDTEESLTEKSSKKRLNEKVKKANKRLNNIYSIENDKTEQRSIYDGKGYPVRMPKVNKLF